MASTQAFVQMVLNSVCLPQATSAVDSMTAEQRQGQWNAILQCSLLSGKSCWCWLWHESNVKSFVMWPGLVPWSDIILLQHFHTMCALIAENVRKWPIRVLGQPVTDEVRSKGQKWREHVFGENTFISRFHFISDLRSGQLLVKKLSFLEFMPYTSLTFWNYGTMRNSLWSRCKQ